MAISTVPAPARDPRPLARQLGLTDDEYDRIVATLGREPSTAELGTFSVMWSEHCSYKSSKTYLRTLPTEGERILVGPGENAGVVDVGGGVAVTFKIESHNHPSFVEPFQGAATGVGGIIRDILTMGARPIALLDPLRFGDPASDTTRRIVDGVVRGIGHYGNSIGVATGGGETAFDPCYQGNPLVNVLCVGVLPADRRHADRVAVVTDAADHAVDDPAGRVAGRVAEAQRVQQGDGARSHGQDVADDAADAGRGALERLDEAGMVVALDLERHRHAAADVDHPRVLPGPHQDALALRGQGAQVGLGALVGAVLRPHHGEGAELCGGGLAAEGRNDAVVLVVGEPELACKRTGIPRRSRDGADGHAGNVADPRAGAGRVEPPRPGTRTPLASHACAALMETQ